MQYLYTLIIQGVGSGVDMIDMTWLSAIFVGAGCLALGYIIGVRHPGCVLFMARTAKDTAVVVDGNKKTRAKQPLEVLVVRNDLKMGKGKIAAQCSHATLGLYKKIFQRAPKALSRRQFFLSVGGRCAGKLIESEDDMLVLQERAKSLNIPTHIVIDAGRTQIAPSSRTVMAFLGPAKLVDDVTVEALVVDIAASFHWVLFTLPYGWSLSR